MKERPTCQTEGCDNVAERVGFGKAWRRWCSSCRKRRYGMPISTYQRTKYKKLREHHACEQCDLADENPAFYDVHHRNGISNDFSFDNLELLCPNCHRSADLALYTRT